MAQWQRPTPTVLHWYLDSVGITESMSVEDLERKIAELTAKGGPDANVKISDLYRGLGFNYMMSLEPGSIEKTVEAYRKAIAMRPDCPDIHYELATNLSSKPLEAAECYLAALQLCPTHSLSLQQLAIIRYAQKDYAEAERLCRKALEAPNEDCGVAHVILCKLAFTRGDVRSSQQHFVEGQRYGDANNTMMKIDYMLINMVKNLEEVEKSKLDKDDQKGTGGKT